MKTRMTQLLLSTALTLPMAAGAQAQQADATCSDLELLLQEQLTDDVPAEAGMTEDDINGLITAGDDAECAVVFVQLQDVAASGTDTAEGEASDEAVMAESERAVVKLEDEVIIEGMVYLDQTSPSVQVESGKTDVQVSSAQPDVTVQEGQAEILIRQAPAKIMMDMPQPTIRIEQPAPEIVVTMPEPGVDVANARPQVEVRQADPIVTVTQSRPGVELELQRAEEGSEGGVQVTDRKTGETFAPGAAGEPRTVEDADVQMTAVEPTVTYEESRDGENANVTVNRAQPNIRFESAEPVIEFNQQGEPKIEMVQVGEPVVTFNEANSAEGEDQAAAAMETEEAEMESEASIETEEALEAEPQTEMAEEDAVIEGEAIEEVEAAEAEAAEMTEEAELASGPVVEREGYEMVAAEDIVVSDLEDATVYGVNDETIGDIGDISVSADGKIEAVIVEVGGFLGMGEKPVSLPFDELTILRSDAGETRVFIEATEQDLKSMDEVQQ